MKNLTPVHSGVFADKVFGDINSNFTAVKSAIDTLEASGGGGGGAPAENLVVEVTDIGMGTFANAAVRATAQPNVCFQWILVQPVTGGTVTKVIWHKGGGVFIDALGAIISE